MGYNSTVSWEGTNPTKIKTQKRWTKVAHHENLIRDGGDRIEEPVHKLYKSNNQNIYIEWPRWDTILSWEGGPYSGKIWFSFYLNRDPCNLAALGKKHFQSLCTCTATVPPPP